MRHKRSCTGNGASQLTMASSSAPAPQVCAICCESRGGPFMTLRCKHEFHVHCIGEWFKDCPLCRGPVSMCMMEPRGQVDVLWTEAQTSTFKRAATGVILELAAKTASAERETRNAMVRKFGALIASIPFQHRIIFVTMKDDVSRGMTFSALCAGCIAVYSASHVQLEFEEDGTPFHAQTKVIVTDRFTTAMGSQPPTRVFCLLDGSIKVEEFERGLVIQW